MIGADALPFVIPLVVLQVALILLGLWDLSRPERRVRGGRKWPWGVLVVLVSIIGPLVYFLVGREDT